MGEITLEQCIKREEEQAAKFYAALEAVRVETKQDINLIRAAVQDIDRSVSRIMGWAGLTGNGSPPHPHHRADDDTERMHQRQLDALMASTAAIEAMNAKARTTTTTTTTTDGLPALPRWAVIGLAGFVLLVFVLIVSDKAFERMKNPPSILSRGADATVTK